MSLRRERLPSAALRRSSASWRRLCRPAMPAASSRMRRRCSGLALTSSPIWPWRTRAGERAPVAASSNRMRTSRARTSRPLMRKAEPASRSMRRVTSTMSLSLNSDGALRAELSMKIVTSAVLRGGRWVVPLKITSSMAAARMLLCEVSPITQRSASSRLDLPQPLGPTTPVSPFSITSSVGSTKDLKPSSRSRLMCMRCASPRTRGLSSRDLFPGSSEPRTPNRRSMRVAGYRGQAPV